MKKMGDIEPKQLLYVQIYDELYKRIMSGEFPVGSLLPPETKLAELLHASRVTLRQALSLLQEDGLIKSVRGKGNIVTRPMQNEPDGLEKITHPIRLCCDQMPDNVEMDCHLELPTDYMKTVLKKESAAILVAERWYKCNNELIAYSVSFIPIEVAEKLQVNFADHQALFTLLEEGAYHSAVSSALEIRIANTIRFITNRYVLEEDNPTLLISENLYFGEKYPYIYNKHYLISPECSICVNGIPGGRGHKL